MPSYQRSSVKCKLTTLTSVSVFSFCSSGSLCTAGLIGCDVEGLVRQLRVGKKITFFPLVTVGTFVVDWGKRKKNYEKITRHNTVIRLIIRTTWYKKSDSFVVTLFVTFEEANSDVCSSLSLVDAITVFGNLSMIQEQKWLNSNQFPNTKMKWCILILTVCCWNCYGANYYSTIFEECFVW